MRYGFIFISKTPRFGYDGFLQRHILTHLVGTLLILVYDFGEAFKGIDEVHAGGMGVRHGNEAVVELVFVVAFYHKSVLNGLLAVNN